MHRFLIVCNFACSWGSSAYSAQERTASFSPMWRGGVLFCSQHRPWTILGESRPDSEATGRLIAWLPVLTVVDGCWWTRWKITFGGWCNMMQLLDPKKQRSPWFAKKHQKIMFFPHCLYIIRVCIGNSMTVNYCGDMSSPSSGWRTLQKSHRSTGTTYIHLQLTTVGHLGRSPWSRGRRLHR